MILEGTIKQLLGMKEGVSASGNEWKLAEYLMETDGQYPKNVKFDIFGSDKISELSIIVGEHVRLGAEVESRQYNNKWYTNVRVYARLEDEVAPAPAKPATQPMYENTHEPVSASNEVEECSSDLPF